MFLKIGCESETAGELLELTDMKSHIHLLAGTPREEVPASALQAILMPAIENPLALV